MNSNEYVIQRAKGNIVAVDRLLKGIKAGKQNELGHWVNLAYILMDPAETELIGVLCERRIIKPCPYGVVDDYRSKATWLAKMFAKTIVLGVIGPKYGLGFQK